MSETAQAEKPKEKDVSFSEALIQRVDDIAPLLPAHIKKERFIASAHAAVKQNPDLLDCTVRSLFNALTKAAQDGLLPDGREGVITFYKTKIEVNGKEVYAKIAAWNPMAYGLRKRAREIDGIIIDAQVVCENDHFIWHQGDDPRIEHEPAKLGTDRGPLIGVYAIFRRENGHILHREIMDRTQVMATKEQSRAKTSLMWTTFETEGWRKAVVRRGMKTVPVSEDLERIITRDDENFDFKNTTPEPPSAPALSPPPAPKPTEAAKARVIEAVVEATVPKDEPNTEWGNYFAVQKLELADAKTAHDRQAVCDTVHDSINGAVERAELTEEQADALRDQWDAIAG